MNENAVIKRHYIFTIHLKNFIESAEEFDLKVVDIQYIERKYGDDICIISVKGRDIDQRRFVNKVFPIETQEVTEKEEPVDLFDMIAHI